ncbi:MULTISPECIES: hypothetical protein [unclassified Streptomyces]|uniref:hypothetical protein n=1 Tax=unclassified Streptomyces TaxID=2593676 RepID=UPI00081B4EB7|nr:MULTISPECIES: hypothetical protein [unclassified Streptomyces]MYQ54454.1 hypothetical protein [Streptomyces sp. SID4941]SCE23625.1 hypothetical protein GA0115247_12904 [Streptomyces sp. PalvLS-984]SDC71869.1 hypothetical protein F558DRAFT_02463 [Streptomyces sp. AmelKG-A3]
MPTSPKNSKVGLALNLGSSALAIVRTAKQVRRARGTQDALIVLNTVAGLLPLITSALLVLRRLRGRSQEPAR